MPIMWNYDYGWSGFIVMSLWMIFWSVGLTLLILWLVRLLNRRSGISEQRSAPGIPNEPSALEILQRRYALGELDTATFEDMRAHVHYIVTAYGVAALHGRDLAERARRLITIAAPQFREELARAAMNRRFKMGRRAALGNGEIRGATEENPLLAPQCASLPAPPSSGRYLSEVTELIANRHERVAS